MRIALLLPVLMLAACNVTKDGNDVTKDGNAVTVQYDQNKAQNTAADVGNTAQNIAADISNDVQKTGDKIENKVGNTDVDVHVGNKDEQKTTTKTRTTKTENKAE